MTLLEQWRQIAYNTNRSKDEQNLFWSKYNHDEKMVYDALLKIEKHPILDTFQNFANKFNVDYVTMIGFLDGINDSLKISNDIANISEDTIITLDYDAETLYKNLCEAKATDIYELPIWDKILPYRKQAREEYQSEQVKQKAREDYLYRNNAECPYCHPKNTKKITGLSKAGSVALWGVFAMGKVSKQWHCNNCKSDF